MRIDLNLATRPIVNRTPHFVLLGVLGAAAVSLTTWNVAAIIGSRGAQRAVETQLADLDADERDLEARRAAAESRLATADLKPLTIRAEAANSVLAQKAVSWSLLLERLEELLPWNAALKQIGTSIGPKGVRLDLVVRAKTYDDALSVIESLESSPCFSDVYPTSEYDAKAARVDFEMSIDANHDPYCGATPAGAAGRKVKLGIGRRGRRG